MGKQQFKRKKKLILPGMQFRMIGAFGAAAGIAILIQAVTLVHALTSLAESAPNDLVFIIDQVRPIAAKIILITAFITGWCTFSIGIMATHRVAGPVFRLERFLRETIEGKQPEDCFLRSGDELKELCRLINLATAPVRKCSERTPHDGVADALAGDLSVIELDEEPVSLVRLEGEPGEAAGAAGNPPTRPSPSPRRRPSRGLARFLTGDRLEPRRSRCPIAMFSSWLSPRRSRSLPWPAPRRAPCPPRRTQGAFPLARSA